MGFLPNKPALQGKKLSSKNPHHKKPQHHAKHKATQNHTKHQYLLRTKKADAPSYPTMNKHVHMANNINSTDCRAEITQQK